MEWPEHHSMTKNAFTINHLTNEPEKKNTKAQTKNCIQHHEINAWITIQLLPDDRRKLQKREKSSPRTEQQRANTTEQNDLPKRGQYLLPISIIDHQINDPKCSSKNSMEYQPHWMSAYGMSRYNITFIPDRWIEWKPNRSMVTKYPNCQPKISIYGVPYPVPSVNIYHCIGKHDHNCYQPFSFNTQSYATLHILHMYSNDMQWFQTIAIYI